MSTTIAQSATTPRLDQRPTKAWHLGALRLWLSTIALLIVVMILVGGATRLTDSGLSITEWQPIMGVVPPLSDTAWQKAFAAYQQIPEYLHLKQGMSLDEFKTIYWWEWVHRFLGRCIGLVFLVPFVVFWIAGAIPKPLMPRLLGLFALGGLQGVVGWYMVKSGLVDRFDVSQYRLAAHLGLAVAILGYTLWLLFGLGREGRGSASSGLRAAVWLAAAVLALVFLQILTGALVAGLDAGLGFNTWPLINGAFVPEGLGGLAPWYMNLFENRLAVQFDHRMLGYAVVLATLAQAVWFAAARGPSALLASAFAVACFALLQATLGVWTLLLAVPISLGLAHQAGAVLLFGAALYHLWLTLAPELPARAPQTSASA
ncbi:MAG: COX15/CtaA family protein [Methyloceanibacter sp.]